MNKDVMSALALFGLYSSFQKKDVHHRVDILTKNLPDTKKGNKQKQKIIDAGALLIDKYDEIHSSTSDVKLHQLEKVEEVKEEDLNITIRDIILFRFRIVSTVLAFITLFAATLIIVAYPIYKYDQLQEMMGSFSSENMVEIGALIESLPKGYRELEEIKAEYETIMTAVEDIEAVGFELILNEYDEYVAARNGYYDLVALSTSNDNWDLDEYINKTDLRIPLMHRNLYTEDYLYNFYFHILSESNKEISILLSTLPSDRAERVLYHYYVDNEKRTINYALSSDQTVVFNAYKIFSATEEEVVIHCYSNGETYTLYDSTID